MTKSVLMQQHVQWQQKLFSRWQNSLSRTPAPRCCIHSPGRCNCLTVLEDAVSARDLAKAVPLSNLYCISAFWVSNQSHGAFSAL